MNDSDRRDTESDLGLIRLLKKISKFNPSLQVCVCERERERQRENQFPLSLRKSEGADGFIPLPLLKDNSE